MAEGGGLENRYTLSGIGGSNPPLSAMLIDLYWIRQDLKESGSRIKLEGEKIFPR